MVVMIMIAIVRMAVIVRVLVIDAMSAMRPMIVMMLMAVILRAMAMRRCGGIGAAFRIEGRLDRGDFGAKAARHILDDVIAPDAQSASRQFGRQMTIAEVPGDSDEGLAILAADFGERLRRGDDLDDAPVVENEPVARAQHDRLRQIEQEGDSAHARHGEASAIAVVIVENDGISRRAAPRTSGTNRFGVDHGRIMVKKLHNADLSRFGFARVRSGCDLPYTDDRPRGKDCAPSDVEQPFCHEK